MVVRTSNLLLDLFVVYGNEWLKSRLDTFGSSEMDSENFTFPDYRYLSIHPHGTYHTAPSIAAEHHGRDRASRESGSQV